MSNSPSYKHVQYAPLCLLLYVLAGVFFVLGWVLEREQPFPWLFPPIGLFMLVLAASFHHLTVEDQADRLSVSFGPVALFRRSIKYDAIISAEIGRTTLLDGWGIHMSLRGGWVWNLWGRDCVVLQLRKGILRIGTDDAEDLAAFLQSRIVDDNP
jgi:hypothetical protein